MDTADYDQFLVFHELQYWNVMLFGLAKQWTPVMCSGLSLAGEPQVPFASLPMLLGYALGPLPGIVLGNAIYLTLGWVGGYLYSGLWFPEPARRALAASVFIGNGFFICRLVHGHLDFMPFLALPLALWIIHRATQEPEPHLAGSRSAVAILLLGVPVHPGRRWLTGGYHPLALLDRDLLADFELRAPLGVAIGGVFRCMRPHGGAGCGLSVADDQCAVRLPPADRRHLHRAVVAALVHVDSHARQSAARQWHRHRVECVHRAGVVLPHLALSADVAGAVAARAARASARRQRGLDLAGDGQPAPGSRAALAQSV